MKRREEMSLAERLYIPAVLDGLRVTLGRLAKNFYLHVMHAFGFCQSVQADVSISYPNERREYPERYRGRHRLTLKPDGSVKCTSCFLCATACPSRCIFIEPAEHADKHVEKFPHRYEIDTLLCIYCGYCVEACPVDAIRMDTGIHPEVYSPDPRMFIEDKELLMERSRQLEKHGPVEMYRRHMHRMQELEKHPFSSQE